MFSWGLAATQAVRASDHGDAPNVDNDSGADIADLYAFLDPNDNTQVVMLGTVHGFIVPGEAGGFAKFDPTFSTALTSSRRVTPSPTRRSS